MPAVVPHRLMLSRALLCVAALAVHGIANAGMMDWIRSYDLNDYALGVAVAPSQSPYLDADGSVIVYPYLTSFRHSVFLDDWLIIRDGDLGVRWVNDTGWELGLVGRVSAGGLGSGDPPALRGLEDREWTLELGPTIGWRAWPVHIYLKSYAELLGRRDGNISELAFMLPREYDWGFLVPSFEFVHQNDDFTSYFFGVGPTEANALRPEYQPGAATNMRLKLRYGYRLSDRWLLSGSVSYDRLDDAIVDSPIVGRDSLWSGSIGIAYDADVFQPRYYPYGDHVEPTFEIRVGAFFDSATTTIERDAADGSPGTPIDVNKLLGVDDDEVLTQIDAFVRIARFHRLELSYFEFGRRGATTLEQDIVFGDLSLAQGTSLSSKVDTSVLRFSYSYSLMKDFQKELGVTAGLHYTKMKITLAPEGGQREVADTDRPLPVLGVHGSASLSPKWQARAQVAAFWQDFDRYDGFMISASFEVSRSFGDTIRAGVGLNYYRLELTSTNKKLQGELITEHLGPLLFLSAGF